MSLRTNALFALPLCLGLVFVPRARAQDAALRDVYARILSGEYRAPARAPVPETFSATPVANESARAHIARGGAAERDGRLAEARREYVAALEGTSAGQHALYVGIGRLAQVEGDTGAAVDAFQHAVRSNPGDPALRRELAAALVAAHQFENAFAELVAALRIVPDDAEALAAVGQLFLDSDRPQDAIPPLRRALALKEDRYQTHYALAVALSRAGQTAEAAREFEQFERQNRQALDARRRAVAGQPASGESPR